MSRVQITEEIREKVRALHKNNPTLNNKVIGSRWGISGSCVRQIIGNRKTQRLTPLGDRPGARRVSNGGAWQKGSEIREKDSVTFEVPAIPPSTNKLTRRHWTFRHRMVKLWMAEIHAATHGDRLSRLRTWALNSKRVQVEIVIHHAGEFDPDNLGAEAKIPLDAMKRIGAIEDDAATFVNPVVRQEKSKRKEARTCFSVYVLGGENVTVAP